MNQGRIIVITGSPGTGKTTTASIVAKESDMDKSVHVFLVRLIGMACLSPRLRILVEFLQEIYIIFMMVGLRPIPLLLRTR